MSNIKINNISNIIITPVYNDWQSFKQLVNELSKISSNTNWSIEKIIAVNDGSYESIEDIDFSSILPVTVLNLNNNMGHQRAISIGLSYVNDSVKEVDNIIVMDCDGEDRPVDIEKLIEALQKNNSQKIIFAKRKKRSEGFTFKLFYKLYKWFFYCLTSQKLDFGNFSSIPRKMLTRVIAIPELWNHYSGAIMKSKIPYISIATNRGDRYQGNSKMNFQNLVLHGLSSISIYLDIVSIRLLFVAISAIIFTFFGLSVVLGLTFFTDLAIPGWPSIVALSLLNILAIFLLTTFLILLFQLNQKNTIKLPPKQFYKDFILSIHEF